jgi:hypothetical protein
MVVLDDEASMREVGQRLLSAVSAKPVPQDDGTSLDVTISVGATRLVRGETTQQAIARADKALYAAKENGRNRMIVVEHDAAMPSPDAKAHAAAPGRPAPQASLDSPTARAPLHRGGAAKVDSASARVAMVSTGVSPSG